MKDNYSWLDQSLRAIIDYKDPEIAIVEVKSRVAKQIEIEKLRARISEVQLWDEAEKAGATHRSSKTQHINSLTEKLKELES